MKIENVQARFDQQELSALANALNGIDEEVYLFGSRVNLEKRGGDIDLLVYSKKNSLELSMLISCRFFLECEEKIDVLVLDKDNLTDEQKIFIKTLKTERIN